MEFGEGGDINWKAVGLSLVFASVCDMMFGFTIDNFPVFFLSASVLIVAAGGSLVFGIATVLKPTAAGEVHGEIPSLEGDDLHGGPGGLDQPLHPEHEERVHPGDEKPEALHPREPEGTPSEPLHDDHASSEDGHDDAHHDHTDVKLLGESDKYYTVRLEYPGDTDELIKKPVKVGDKVELNITAKDPHKFCYCKKSNKIIFTDKSSGRTLSRDVVKSELSDDRQKIIKVITIDEDFKGKVWDVGVELKCDAEDDDE